MREERAQAICIIGGEVFAHDRVIEGGCVLTRDGLIVAVGTRSEITIPSDAEVLDATGLRVVPGLIDLHVHGALGQDAATGDIDLVSEALAEQGVTAFLATVAPMQWNDLIDVLQHLSQRVECRDQGGRPSHRHRVQTGLAGARMAGIYLEGPYISPRRAGVLSAAFFRRPRLDEAAELLRAGRGAVRVVTVAPELDGAQELIAWLSAQRVIPSVGHSEASLGQVDEAIRRGLRHATHVFNAMPQFHHRDPGVVGAVLARREIVAEVIADGHHLHPTTLDIVMRLKGPDRVCLVSDLMPLAGLPPGVYTWLGQRVVIGGGTARLENGTLAGSITPLNQALCNLVEATGLPLEIALRTATSTPARVLALNAGAIEVGRDADIVAFDTKFEAQLTMVRGRVVNKEDMSDEMHRGCV